MMLLLPLCAYDISDVEGDATMKPLTNEPDQYKSVDEMNKAAYLWGDLLINLRIAAERCA